VNPAIYSREYLKPLILKNKKSLHIVYPYGRFRFVNVADISPRIDGRKGKERIGLIGDSHGGFWNRAKITTIPVRPRDKNFLDNRRKV
jgi:hypothetical protein